VHRVQAGLVGAANAVTLVRGVLAYGVAALVVESLAGPARVPEMVALATVVLVLDAVDGQVARRTKTVSAFGARFDMEVDAFLILVLSVYVAQTTGWWVLAIGAARYVFVAARLVFPWLRGTVPPRFWCKVVAAVQGVVLTVAVADVLPTGVAEAALAVALVLLAESFGREAWQLWRASGAGFAPVELAAAGRLRDG
jgi:phosphatidylglycerophosphate synthase